MIYLFLATGFEEIEAMATLDILRRCKLDIQTVSITGTRLIVGAHGIPIMADRLFRKKEIERDDVLILPGGMPGAKNLMTCDGFCKTLVSHNANGGVIAAICAAPMILGNLDILINKKAVCYPGFEDELLGANIQQDLVVKDGNIITAKGPGAAFEFAFKIASLFLEESELQKIKYGMILLEK